MLIRPPIRLGGRQHYCQQHSIATIVTP